MNKEISSKAEGTRYYTFRIKKRDVHGIALVLSFWFLWSEGAEIAKLFGNLLDAMK
ncbi:hypothetical protein [Stenotrophomonas bentonitica]|uniref:hypothetical protein n=1 Tax=Stenotrophomonas bentonitica TaxID=1450134 RepID=UPI00345E0D6A